MTKNNTSLIPSSESTGGSGVYFEQHVGAYWLSLLLVSAIPPIEKDTTVSEVSFQVRPLGWNTDDCLITCKSEMDSQKLLICQVKKTFAVGKNDDCTKTITAFWKDFKNNELFKPLQDSLVLITLRGTNTLLTHLVGLFDIARSVRNSDEFDHRFSLKGPIHTKTKNYYSVIKSIITSHENHEPSHDEFWRFLKSIFVLSLDLNTSTSQTESAILSLLAYTTENTSLDEAENTWNTLLARVSSDEYGMPKAGQFKYEDLPEKLRNKHNPIGTREKRALKRMKEHSSITEKTINNKLKTSLHIPRNAILQNLIEKLENTNVLFISGVAGIGKSAIAKDILNLYAQNYYTISFRSEEFACAHLDQVLLNAQLNINVKELQSILAAQDKILILIESAERLLEKTVRDAFSDLINVISENINFKLLITCRDYSIISFCNAFFTSQDIKVDTVNISGFDDRDLEKVAEKFPEIKPLLSTAPLRNLLKIPYILDKALNMNWSDVNVLPKCEREFRELFWCSIIKYEQLSRDALPSRRAKTFINITVKRAKELSPYILYDGRDLEALECLKNDSLIITNPKNDTQVAPAHDVLEDWAILKWLNNSYPDAQTNSSSDFCREVSEYPAIRRCYRKWIIELVESDSEKSDELFQSIFKQNEFTAHFIDDTIVSLLISGKSESFFTRNEKIILNNDAALLKKIIHLLRVACTMPSQLHKKLGLDFIYNIPYGNAWSTVLDFIYKKFEHIPIEMSLLLIGLIEGFVKSVSHETPYPPGHKPAFNIAYNILEKTKETYMEKGIQESLLTSLAKPKTNYWASDIQKRLLAIIAKIPKSEPEKFENLFRGSNNTEHAYLTEQLQEIIFETGEGCATARDFPELICEIAANYILYSQENLFNESQNPSFIYNPINNDILFGIQKNIHFMKAIVNPFDTLFFFQLLRCHPKQGIEFILKITNACTDCFVQQKITSHYEQPYEVELKFSDGNKKNQWCSSLLWNLCHEHSTGPKILQALLMCFEEWLLTSLSTNLTKVDTLLLGILKHSNSVALSAIVATVATAYPYNAKETLLVFLGSPKCILLDRERWCHNQSNPLSTPMQNIPYSDYFEKLGLNISSEADYVRIRSENLEMAIVRIQQTDYVKQIHSILDKYKLETQKIPDNNEENLIWKFSLCRMDLREHKIYENPQNNNTVLLVSEVKDQQLSDMIKWEEDKQQVTNYLAGLSMWGYKVFKYEDLEKYPPKQWKEKLVEVLNLPQIDLKLKDTYLQGAKEYIATICLRDHWDDLDKAEIECCIETLCKCVEETANDWNKINQIAPFLGKGNLPASWALSLLLTNNINVKAQIRVKNTLICALVHPNNKVREYTINGIAENLWNYDRNFVIKCINTLAYEAIEIEKLYNEQKIKHLKKDNSIEQKVAEKLRTIFYTDQFPEGNHFKDMNINTWFGELANFYALTILSGNLSDEISIFAFSRLGLFLKQCWDNDEIRNKKSSSFSPLLGHHVKQCCNNEIEKKKTITRDRNNKYDHEIEMMFQDFLLHSTSEVAIQAILPIVEVTNKHTRKVRNFILDLTFKEYKFHKPEQFWMLWKLFAEKIQSEINANNLNTHDLRTLLPAMFLNSIAEPSWKSLKGYENYIYDFFESMPACQNTLDAYLFFLKNVGSDCLPDSFILIADKLRQGNPAEILQCINSISLLESYLLKHIYGNPLLLKKNQQLKEAVFLLLDTLVTQGSSVAFSLRDDFATPISI